MGAALLQFLVSTPPNPPLFLPCCSLSKRGQRWLSSFDKARGDLSATQRLVNKFISSSSKPELLNTLSHCISNDGWTIALPMYKKITQASWYRWNPKYAADLIALLDKYQQFDEAENISAESVKKLEFRDLSLFYCNLIDSYSKHGLKNRVFDTYASLKHLRHGSADRQAYQSMVNGLSLLNEPHDAEKMLQEMEGAGFRPSSFEFRSIVLAYGRCGSFSEMTRIVKSMEDSGFVLDTICANMILSSYGAHREFSEMVFWIRRMRDSKIVFSVRTYNSVLNACPSVTMILQVIKILPLSIEEFYDKVKESSSWHSEWLLVQELVASCGILAETVQWCSSEWKLDLHGMHIGSAYLILLQWIEELRARLNGGCAVAVPLEVSIVCGVGKHSNIRGESPVKGMVSEMMRLMASPLKVDRLNSGRFVARGEAVRAWLCRLNM